jgi:hypothetical protein
MEENRDLQREIPVDGAVTGDVGGRQSGAKKVTEGAESVARESMREARRLSEKARDAARRGANRTFDQLGRKLHDMESGLQEMAARSDSNQYTRKAADTLHRVTERLDRTSADEIIDNARRRVASRPGLVFGALLLLGFAAGRLLKE